MPGKSLETLNRLGNWEYVYLAGILIWFIFGLGYLSMIMSAIQNLICVKVFHESQEDNVDSENIVTAPTTIGTNDSTGSDSKDHIGPLDHSPNGFNNPNVLDDLNGPNGLNCPNGLNGPNGPNGLNDVNGTNSLNGHNNYGTFADIETINPNPNVPL